MFSIKSHALSAWSLIRRRWIWAITFLVIAVGIAVFIKVSSDGAIETVSPVTSDLVRVVKIAGKVIPKESADLSFETSGALVAVLKDVGDDVGRGETIARLDSRTISSDIVGAEAQLSLREAELEKLEGAGILEAQIDNSKRALIQTIVDTYTASDDAVHNKTDQIFIDTHSSDLEIVYAFSDNFDLRDKIILDRAFMDDKLKAWGSLVATLDLKNYTEESLAESKRYLSETSSYINSLTQAINLFKPSSSLPQATIDTYKSDALTAKNNLNQASQDLIKAEDKFRGLLGDVPVQVARVESAKATLSSYRAQLSKTYLISPLSGVVSKQDAKIGQVVSAAVPLVSVISKDLEVEAFIPEILISEVRLGNLASVTLDAYGDRDLFEARVIHIDPAETVRDGVSTYKVRLAFNKPDERIRPGMTLNIEIETFRKPDTVLIPERAVVREEDETYLYVLDARGNQEKIRVKVGEKDSSGKIELVSSLAAGSRVIINPPKN